MHWRRPRKRVFVRSGSNVRGKRRRAKHFGTLVDAFRDYCTNTTLHGLRYIVDPKLHAIERFLWFFLFAISSFIASRVIYNLALRFQAAPTSIGIESMSYKISDIPFPSVTICPNDRIDWRKVLDLEKHIFSDSTDNRTIQTFRDVLARLSTISFGDFDEFDFLRNRNLHPFAGINITNVFLNVTPDCKVLLSGCWWRSSYRNCCEIFELQKTEYGFCYSFNSELAEGERNGRRKGEAEAEARPRRASGYGDWSGVKVTIHLGNVTKPPDSVEVGGIILILNGPNVWPNSGTMIPVGSMVGVSLDGVSGFATERVLELDESRIPCKYEEDGVYNQETCLSLCKRAYVIKYCGCNPSFLFPSNAERDCSVEDFLCLLEHNDVFNDYYVLTDESIQYGRTAMICDCPPECEYYLYDSQFSSVPLDASNDIMLDVHFAGQTSFRYKTDIVFTNLDLLVSFGGIIGLFLGGSLLSAAELVYYVIVALFCYLRSWWKPEKEKFRSEGLAAVAPVTAMPTLPILDYSLVKPRSKKIPLFMNYDAVKLNLNKY